MIKIIAIGSSSAVVENGNAPVTIEFRPLDLGGVSVKQAFILGMAYDLLENRGMALPPLPAPPEMPSTEFDRDAASEEI